MGDSFVPWGQKRPAHGDRNSPPVGTEREKFPIGTEMSHGDIIVPCVFKDLKDEGGLSIAEEMPKILKKVLTKKYGYGIIKSLKGSRSVGNRRSIAVRSTERSGVA